MMKDLPEEKRIEIPQEDISKFLDQAKAQGIEKSEKEARRILVDTMNKSCGALRYK